MHTFLFNCGDKASPATIAPEILLAERGLVVSVSFLGQNGPCASALHTSDFVPLSALGADEIVSVVTSTLVNPSGAASVATRDMLLHFSDSQTHFPQSGANTSTLVMVLTKGFPSPVGIRTDPCLRSCSSLVRNF